MPEITLLTNITFKAQQGQVCTSINLFLSAPYAFLLVVAILDSKNLFWPQWFFSDQFSTREIHRLCGLRRERKERRAEEGGREGEEDLFELISSL